jgi:hypothetical protein
MIRINRLTDFDRTCPVGKSKCHRKIIGGVFSTFIQEPVGKGHWAQCAEKFFNGVYPKTTKMG